MARLLSLESGWWPHRPQAPVYPPLELAEEGVLQVVFTRLGDDRLQVLRADCFLVVLDCQDDAMVAFLELERLGELDARVICTF